MRATKRFENINADYHLPMKKTGLPFVVWIWPRGSAGRGVRVGVALGPNAAKAELVSVAIQPDVRVVIDVSNERIVSIETLFYPEFFKALTELLP